MPSEQHRLLAQLFKEHETLEQKLVQLKLLVFGNADGSDSSKDKLIDLIDSLQEEIKQHVEREEYILFPAMLQVMGYVSQPIEVMKQEHAQLTEQLKQLREEVRCSKGPAHRSPVLKRLVREVAHALYDHMYKENRLLFPMARYVLTKKGD